MATKRTATTIYSIENRGTAESPFGMIYIGDTRVGYHRDEDTGHLRVWPTNSGYCEEPTRGQLLAAWAAVNAIYEEAI